MTDADSIFDFCDVQHLKCLAHATLSSDDDIHKKLPFLQGQRKVCQEQMANRWKTVTCINNAGSQSDAE